MRHDATWWALVLAIVALVLMLPVNLLANFLTPMMKNWWAGRSRKTLDQRIGKLEKWLTEVERFPLLTTAEEYILRAFNRVAVLVSNAVQFGAITVFIFSDWIGNLHAGKLPLELRLFVGLGMAANFTLVTMFTVFNGGFIEARTERGRAKVKDEITKLLEKKQQWK